MKRDDDWLSGLFAAIDRKDTEAFLGFLTPDARFRYGNMPEVQGQEAIREAVAGFFDSIQSLQHRLIQSWSQNDRVICQGEVTYTRHDGSRLSVPFCNIFGMRGGKVDRYQIYIDISQLYA